MLGHGGEEIHRLVHFHPQHVADALAAPGHRQRFRIETGAVAGLARNLHVGQEAHADGAHALAFAGRAAALAGVEGKPPCGIAARTRFQGVGEELADRVPEADVGRGAGTRRLADRRLVHLEHPVDRLVAVQPLAADPGLVLARRIGIAAGLGVALLHHRLHVGQQHVARQRRLARAGNTGDRHQPPQRHVDVHVAQVVQVGAAQLQPFSLTIHLASWLDRMLHRMQQVAPGDRFGHRADIRRRSPAPRRGRRACRRWVRCR